MARVVLAAEQLVTHMAPSPTDLAGHLAVCGLEPPGLARLDPRKDKRSDRHLWVSPSYWASISWTTIRADSRSARSGAVSTSCSGLRSKRRNSSRLAQSEVSTKPEASSGSRSSA